MQLWGICDVYDCVQEMCTSDFVQRVLNHTEIIIISVS
jgi:hypothetical protein